MKLSDLANLRYLMFEISRLEEDLADVSYYSSPKVGSDKIMTSVISDPTFNIVERKENPTPFQQTQITRLNRLIERFEFINDWIEKIDNSNIKIYVKLKYMEDRDDVFIASFCNKSRRTIQRWHDTLVKEYLD